VIRKFSLLLTILAALGLIVALVGCGKRGALEAPPQDSALKQPHRTA
jgi:predicted small lipoprotein YifL